MTSRDTFQDGGRLYPLSIYAALLVAATAPGPSPMVAPAPPEYSVTLVWTAPGDDGHLGRATAYDLRYSTEPITAANFLSARSAIDLPAPGAAGALQTATVGGLSTGTDYYFALRTRDEVGNWSALSNVVRFPTVPTGVGDPPLAEGCSLPWPNPARASTQWTLGLPEAAEVEVDVFSVTGRHVRRLASGWRPAGRSNLDWDLRDGSGEKVAAGIYLVRARLGARTWNRRVTVIR